MLVVSDKKFLKTIPATNPVNVYHDETTIYLQTVNSDGVELFVKTKQRDLELISNLTRSVH